MLRYDDDWFSGERYRTWIKGGSKRYRLAVSIDLLEDLSPDEPEMALVMYGDAFLAVAQWKIDEMMTEEGDGVTWLLLGQRDAERIRFGLANV
jgi:hypothetical protein